MRAANNAQTKMAMIIRTMLNGISHQDAVPVPIRMSIIVGVQKGIYDITFIHVASGVDMPIKLAIYPIMNSHVSGCIAFWTSSCRFTNAPIAAKSVA